MKIKRICAALLCMALSLGLSIPCLAEASPAPGITAEVRKIDDGKTVEVSLSSSVPIQSLQGVLAYDSARLKPVSWDGAAVPVQSTWGPLGTLSHELAAGKPALVKQDASAGYLYLAAETILGNVLPADKNLVTVRFECIGGVSDQDTAAASVQFVTDPAIAAETPAHKPAVLINDTGAVTVIATPVVDVTTGPSAGGGDIVAAGKYAITFFDWDGSVIDAISGEGDMGAVVAEKKDSWSQLTAKPGYDFDAWLAVTSDSKGLHTAHETPTSSKNGVSAGSLDRADFSNVQSNLLVQAAYKTNTNVNNGQGAGGALTEDTARYVIGAPTFYQYGISSDDTNGQYAVRGEVKRGSVLRADKPTVLAVVYVGTNAITVKVDLNNTDSTQFEVVVPKQTTKITFTVLDTVGITAWTQGVSRSIEGSALKADIVREGAFALLVDEALAVSKGSQWSTFVNVQCLRDAGYSKVTTGNLDAAKAALVSASTGKLVPLTRVEADQALAGYR